MAWAWACRCGGWVLPVGFDRVLPLGFGFTVWWWLMAWAWACRCGGWVLPIGFSVDFRLGLGFCRLGFGSRRGGG
uniref:Uncharacterized protein n=1 Tax=Fagus sylvatica TaxID=28930 RepID=A0A2N9HJB3_FAGSY